VATVIEPLEFVLCAPRSRRLIVPRATHI